MTDKQTIIEALNKSNFILYALQNRIEEDYRDNLLNTITNNKNIIKELKDISHTEAVKAITQEEIKTDLTYHKFLDELEVTLPESQSLINQLLKYKQEDRHKYLRVLEAVAKQKAIGKEPIKDIKSYLIGALKKEFSNANSSSN